MRSAALACTTVLLGWALAPADASAQAASRKWAKLVQERNLRVE